MKMFVLQNPDYEELYWSDEYGWTELDSADFFLPRELEDDHCTSLKKSRCGRWVSHDIRFNIQGELF